MNKLWITFFVFLLGSSATSMAQDNIEFLNGTQLKGKVIAIHKADREVEFEAVIGGKSQTTRYPYTKLHAVTWKGKRYEVTPKPAGSGTFVPDPSKKRTKAEVNKLIADYGNQPPDWLAQTQLDYPETLDLSWPKPAPKGWNNKKNVGQFIWDRINPNEGRWRSGVKLMIHLLESGDSSKTFLDQVHNSIGGMYFRFFQDYPRAAFWWEKAGAKPGEPNGIGLAECYWRMGNKSMAMDMLDSRIMRLGKIKLLGDMGDTSQALKLADSYASQVKEPHESLLIAGDVARQAGKFKQAEAYYQRVIDLPKMENENYDERHRSRAQASLENHQHFQLLNLSAVPDGTHTGTSLGYEGPVEVAVSIAKGRITEVEVTQHKEKQFYSAITDTTSQIVKKQKLKDVDRTSRATITSAAIINAAAKALAEAKP